jgi:osmotically inducible lipoprotein OsmB
MKPISATIPLLLGFLALAACEETTDDRGLRGAGVAGLVGAGAGALTSPSQVDLGKPVWEC